jgi:hypothetical protein
VVSSDEHIFLKSPLHLLFLDEQGATDDDGDEFSLTTAEKNKMKEEDDDYMGHESFDGAFAPIPTSVTAPSIIGLSFSSFLARTSSVLFNCLAKLSSGVLPTALQPPTLASLFSDPSLIMLANASKNLQSSGSENSDITMEDAQTIISSTAPPSPLSPFDIFTLNNTPYLSSTTQLISFSTLSTSASLSGNWSQGSCLDSLFPLFYLSSMASPSILSDSSTTPISAFTLSLFPSPILLVFSKDDPLFPASLICSLNNLRFFINVLVLFSITIFFLLRRVAKLTHRRFLVYLIHVTLPEEVSLCNQIHLIRARERSMRNTNSRNREKMQQRGDMATIYSPRITSPFFTSTTMLSPVSPSKDGLSPKFQPSFERININRTTASNITPKKVLTSTTLLNPLGPPEPPLAPHVSSPFSASFSSFEKFVNFYGDLTTLMSSWSEDACGEGYSFIFFNYFC